MPDYHRQSPEHASERHVRDIGDRKVLRRMHNADRCALRARVGLRQPDLAVNRRTASIRDRVLGVVPLHPPVSPYRRPDGINRQLVVPRELGRPFVLPAFVDVTVPTLKRNRG